MKINKNRDILDIVQFGITIVTAIVAVRLNYQQGELSRRIQREGITQTYAEKILGNLDKLKMDPEQRGTVIIDMLDIITSANINTGERPYTDSERQQLIPLRLALATHDADLIAHIGTNAEKRKMWTDTAIQSGNNEIKRTAIRALAQIGRYRARETELETFRFCVEKILEISEDFAREPISEEAMQQFALMAEVAEKVPSLLENPPLKALMQRGRTALILIAGRAIKERAEEQQIQPPEPTPPPSGPRPTALQNSRQRNDMDGLQTVLYRETDSRLTTHRTAQSGGPNTFLLASVLDTAQQALKRVDRLNLKQEVDKPLTPKMTDLSTIIAALKDDDAEKRRKAREALAKAGAANVPQLLAALRAEPDNHRIKVGVSFSLSKISEPVTITKAEDADLFVKLTGDDEAEVRQYASEFLMRLSDRDSLNVVIPRFQAVITRERAVPSPNGNAVYNAVVVLGTWMRTLPAGLSVEKDAIAQYLRELQPQLTRDTNWSKTIALINEFNSMAP